MKGDKIVRHFDRNSNKTVTLRKHVTKYKNMRKWMVEFLRKFENRGIKIARVNSIITKSTSFVIYFNFVRCWGSVVMLTSLNKPLVLSPFIEKFMVFAYCIIIFRTPKFLTARINSSHWKKSKFYLAWLYGIISSSSCSRTDRWVHFQQNAGLRLFVHGIDDCYQLNRTFRGFSAQCLSKMFLKEFTVLLLTTSFGRAFQVVIIRIG